MPKSDKVAAEGVFFREQLGKLDWSDPKTPPGFVGGRGQRFAAAPRDCVTGRSTSPQARASGLEEGRSQEVVRVEAVVVGVVGGVLASACVVVLAGTIKRGMWGDRSYGDIADGCNAW